jgi:hypothetical protein
VLSKCWLAMDDCSASGIPAFRQHATIFWDGVTDPLNKRNAPEAVLTCVDITAFYLKLYLNASVYKFYIIGSPRKANEDFTTSPFRTCM